MNLEAAGASGELMASWATETMKFGNCDTVRSFSVAEF